MSEKFNLSEFHEFSLKGNVILKVYPASLEIISLLAPKLEELDAKSADIKTQMELFLDVVYSLIKDDNDITKEALKKVLTIEAGTKIMQKSLGLFGTLLSA